MTMYKSMSFSVTAFEKKKKNMSLFILFSHVSSS